MPNRHPPSLQQILYAAVPVALGGLLVRWLAHLIGW